MRNTRTFVIITTLAIFAFVAAPVFAAPSITITSPKAGETIDGPDVTVKVEAKELTLTDYTKSTTDKAGEGHLHLWMDEANPTKTNAAKAITGTYVFRNLAAGEHVLVVEAVDNTHDSSSPAVKQTVKFTTTKSPTNANATTNAAANTNAAATTTSGTGTIVLVIVVILIVIAIIWYAASRGKGGMPPAPGTPGSPPPTSGTPPMGGEMKK